MMMTIYEPEGKENSFGKAVKAARRAAGLDQESLALLVGVSVSAVKKWEAGNCRPTPTNITKLTAVLSSIPDEYKEALTEGYTE